MFSPVTPFFRVWRPRASPLLELVFAQTGQYQSAVHLHDELELGLAPRHALTLYTRGRWLTVPAGTLIVTLPGEAHAVHTGSGAGVFYSLRINPALLLDLWQELAPGQHDLPRTAPFTTDAALNREVIELHRLCSVPAGLNDLDLEGRLRTVLTRLLLASGAADPPVLQAARSIEEARARLEDAPKAAVSLAELAQGAGLSPFHFARLFRAAIGLAPHAYQLGVRVRRAKALLLGDEPLAQLALNLGFASQSHLTHTFRTQVGVTPTRYRRDSKMLIDLR